MASLLKNQIIKHLARFFKNLSPEQLNLSTLRGQCALTNLELNEDLLAELLELPAWLTIRKAVCSRVLLNVPWMKIKSQPIQLSLDQVNVEINTCSESPSESSANRSSTRSEPVRSAKYGFADKVLDGVLIRIDSLDVVFASPAVRTQLSFLQIVIESRLPNFKQTDDLAYTRLKDAQRRHLLLFKHIQFASMRFEIRSELTGKSSPLRLITRDGSCRITLKKRLSDGQLVAGQLLLQFDELLWIVTDGTLLSALHLVQHVNQLMNEAPMRKQNLPNLSGSKSSDQLASGLTNDRSAQLFTKYDIRESSLHVLVQKLQLHLSDELQRSQCDKLKTGGGVHIQLCRLVLDLYPYHFIHDGKRHWFCYTSPNSLSTDQLLERHLSAHLSHSDAMKPKGKEPESLAQLLAHPLFRNLFSSAAVIRVGDVRVQCVSTSSSNRTTDEPKKPFLRTDGALPGALPAIHLEFHQFFFFEGSDGRRRASLRLKAPDPLMYVHLAPMMLCPDALTVLWANAFLQSVHHGLEEIGTLNQSFWNEGGDLQAAIDHLPHVLIELVLPTLQLNLQNLTLNDKLASSMNGNALEVKCSRINITNSIGEQKRNVSLLNLNLNKIKQSKLFQNYLKGYPWMETDLHPLDESLQKLLDKLLDANTDTSSHNNQLWFLQCEPLWIDSLRTSESRRQALIEPMFIRCCAMIASPLSAQYDQQPPLLTVFADLPQVNVTVDHNQFMLVLRILEQVDELSNCLNSDGKHIASQYQKREVASLFSLSAFLDQIRVNVVLDSLKSANILESKNEHKKLTRLIEQSTQQELFMNDQCVYINSTTTTSVPEAVEWNDDLEIEADEEDEDEKSLRSDLSGDTERLASLILDDLQQDFVNGSERLFGGIVGVLQEDFDLEPAEEAFELTEETTRTNVQESNEKIVVTLNRLLAIRQQIQDGSSSSIVEIPDFNVQFPNEPCTSGLDLTDDESNQQKITLRLDSIPLSSKLEKPKQFVSILLENLQRLHVQVDLLPKITDFLLDPDTEQVPSMLVLFGQSEVRLLDAAVRTPPLQLCLDQTFIERNEQNQLRFWSANDFNDGLRRLLLAHKELRTKTNEQLNKVDNFIFDQNSISSIDETNESTANAHKKVVRTDNEISLAAALQDNQKLKALVENLTHQLEQLQLKTHLFSAD